ncbi:Specific transcriptional repressor [Mycena kentingensis (nom. inval.)]|nr:Specific transcriptional repressor [Mycena kentingensis (nom. inval.)]
MPKASSTVSRVVPRVRSESYSDSDESSKPPRPANSFMCFRSAIAARQAASHIANPKSLNQTNVSSDAGNLWKAMSDEEKAPYREEALMRKAEHQLRYPGYRYQPVGGGPRKSKPASRRTKTRRSPELHKKNEHQVRFTGAPAVHNPCARAAADALRLPSPKPSPTFVAPSRIPGPSYQTFPVAALPPPPPAPPAFHPNAQHNLWLQEVRPIEAGGEFGAELDWMREMSQAKSYGMFSSYDDNAYVVSTPSLIDEIDAVGSDLAAFELDPISTDLYFCYDSFPGHV